MPWISKELYNNIPRKEILKQMPIKKLMKICKRYNILIQPMDDKADIVEAILWSEEDLKKL